MNNPEKKISPKNLDRKGESVARLGENEQRRQRGQQSGSKDGSEQVGRAPSARKYKGQIHRRRRPGSTGSSSTGGQGTRTGTYVKQGATPCSRRYEGLNHGWSTRSRIRCATFCGPMTRMMGRSRCTTRGRRRCFSPQRLRRRWDSDGAPEDEGFDGCGPRLERT